MSGAKRSDRLLAEAVRMACLRAAREGYESAAMGGLCHEGAVEASLDAVRMLDLDVIMSAHAGAPQKNPG